MYVPYSLIFATLIPMIVMVYCYTNMIIALTQSANNTRMRNATLAKHQNTAQVDKLRMAQMNIFQTCFITILFFLSCWLSKDSALILYKAGVYPHLNNYHYAIGRLLIVANSGLNPYIYAIRYKDFQNQFLNLVGLRRAPGSIYMSNSRTALSVIT